jgi:hypothetical protein
MVSLYTLPYLVGVGEGLKNRTSVARMIQRLPSNGPVAKSGEEENLEATDLSRWISCVIYIRFHIESKVIQMLSQCFIKLITVRKSRLFQSCLSQPQYCSVSFHPIQ